MTEEERVTAANLRLERERQRRLTARLSRSVERRFRLRYLPVQPMTQPSEELARGFAFDSFAITEQLRSALKFNGSERSLAELPNEYQQLR
jgi:hypothetical protein